MVILSLIWHGQFTETVAYCATFKCNGLIEMGNFKCNLALIQRAVVINDSGSTFIAYKENTCNTFMLIKIEVDDYHIWQKNIYE